MFGKLLSVFAATLAVASAYTTPVGLTCPQYFDLRKHTDVLWKVGEPTGNPIDKPGLNEQVPAGQPYTITWTPTTQDTVTLLLLRGPSTNVVPLYPIVENIQNTGTYVWTPSTDLQPDTTGYGIQLICDDTGAYQYSTQFGISNPSYTGGSSNSTSTSTPSNSTMSSSSTTVSVLSTGMPASNSSIIQPTGTMSVPSTLGTAAATTVVATTVGTTHAPASTGAAGRLGMSIGGAVAALAAAVAAF